MEFIVMVQTIRNGKIRNDFRGFDDATDATEYANWKASKLREKGYVFEIHVYERVA